MIDAQRTVFFFESIRYFLKHIFVEIFINYESSFNLQFFLVLWQNFVAFFQKVINLIFPLIEKEFSLLILVVFLPQDILELRKNNKFQLLVFFGFLLEARDWIKIFLPADCLNFFFSSSHRGPSTEKFYSWGTGIFRTKCL